VVVSGRQPVNPNPSPLFQKGIRRKGRRKRSQIVGEAFGTGESPEKKNVRLPKVAGRGEILGTVIRRGFRKGDRSEKKKFHQKKKTGLPGMHNTEEDV